MIYASVRKVCSLNWEVVISGWGRYKICPFQPLFAHAKLQDSEAPSIPAEQHVYVRTIVGDAAKSDGVSTLGGARPQALG